MAKPPKETSPSLADHTREKDMHYRPMGWNPKDAPQIPSFIEVPAKLQGKYRPRPFTDLPRDLFKDGKINMKKMPLRGTDGYARLFHCYDILPLGVNGPDEETGKLVRWLDRKLPDAGGDMAAYLASLRTKGEETLSDRLKRAYKSVADQEMVDRLRDAAGLPQPPEVPSWKEHSYQPQEIELVVDAFRAHIDDIAKRNALYRAVLIAGPDVLPTRSKNRNMQHYLDWLTTESAGKFEEALDRFNEFTPEDKQAINAAYREAIPDIVQRVHGFAEYLVQTEYHLPHYENLADDRGR